jgi:hypothetical protein
MWKPALPETPTTANVPMLTATASLEVPGRFGTYLHVDRVPRPVARFLKSPSDGISDCTEAGCLGSGSEYLREDEAE